MSRSWSCPFPVGGVIDCCGRARARARFSRFGGAVENCVGRRAAAGGRKVECDFPLRMVVGLNKVKSSMTRAGYPVRW